MRLIIWHIYDILFDIYIYIVIKQIKKFDLTPKNKATYRTQLVKLTQLATDNLLTVVHLMNKSQSTEC